MNRTLTGTTISRQSVIVMMGYSILPKLRDWSLMFRWFWVKPWTFLGGGVFLLQSYSRSILTAPHQEGTEMIVGEGIFLFQSYSRSILTALPHQVGTKMIICGGVFLLQSYSRCILTAPTKRGQKWSLVRVFFFFRATVGVFSQPTHKRGRKWSLVGCLSSSELQSVYSHSPHQAGTEMIVGEGVFLLQSYSRCILTAHPQAGTEMIVGGGVFLLRSYSRCILTAPPPQAGTEMIVGEGVFLLQSYSRCILTAPHPQAGTEMIVGEGVLLLQSYSRCILTAPPPTSGDGNDSWWGCFSSSKLQSVYSHSPPPTSGDGNDSWWGVFLLQSYSRCILEAPPHKRGRKWSLVGCLSSSELQSVYSHNPPPQAGTEMIVGGVSFCFGVAVGVFSQPPPSGDRNDRWWGVFLFRSCSRCILTAPTKRGQKWSLVEYLSVSELQSVYSHSPHQAGTEMIVGGVSFCFGVAVGVFSQPPPSGDRNDRWWGVFLFRSCSRCILTAPLLPSEDGNDALKHPWLCIIYR